jgi:hypothetical protein
METRPVQVPTYVEIVRWDDTTLINWRKEAAAELEKTPGNEPLRRVFDASTQEVVQRSRMSWGMAPAARRAG